MNASSTDNFALPFLQPGQALKTITHNEALQRLDTGLYLSCSDMAADALPDNPVAGETLILSNTSTEEHAGDIAVFQDDVWLWFTPKAGWSVWDASANTLRIFDGQDWVGPAPNTLPETLPHLGLNTSASPNQRLAIASETSLFTHNGESHRIAVNRAANTDTASLIFQTDYSGNAELGLNGADGFSLKTSSDGTNWTERLSTPAGYSGIRAPAFGSVRIGIANDTTAFIETPATGGILAIIVVSDGAYPTVSHSGLIAYDSGQSPTLVVLAKTNRLEIHGHAVLSGTNSAEGNIGLSAVDGGIYVENRLNNERILSVTFLC